MKLCVLPNDPMKAYYDKGEIKERYFNPENIFDEVHVLSLFDDEIKEELIQTVAGNAKLKIHITGKVTMLNKNRKIGDIIKLVKEINPDVIRSFNPLLQGWVAVKIKQELNIPLVISLHGDYERDLRYHAKKKHDYKSFMKLQLTKHTLEKFAIKNADEVIIVYDFIQNYAKNMGAKKINLIYNRVDLSKFSPKITSKFRKEKPVIICVGRLIKEKNQECLIYAIKDLDVNLLLIGNGVEYQNLTRLVSKLRIEKKVIFETSIFHDKINEYYTSADVFALPVKYGGFAIPALEAAASGIPVILPKHEFDPDPDLISEFALLVENNPESFKKAIQEILSNNSLRNQMIEKGLSIKNKIKSEVLEEKEKNVYLNLFNKN